MMRHTEIFLARQILKVGDFIFGFRDIGGHTFYASGIKKGSKIVDLGGHKGYFSLQMINRYGCCSYVVEPVPHLYKSIPDTPSLKKFNFAIAANVGETIFYESDNIQAGSILNENIKSNGKSYLTQTKTIACFIREQGLNKINLLKVDVEGAEIQLINTMDMDCARCIQQITVEFHDSTPNPNINQEEVREAIKHLASLGFKGTNMGEDNRDWFFINSCRKGLPILAWHYLMFRKKIYTFLRKRYGQA